MAFRVVVILEHKEGGEVVSLQNLDGNRASVFDLVFWRKRDREKERKRVRERKKMKESECV